MTQYLGGEDKLIVHLESYEKPIFHPWPLHNKKLALDRYFYYTIKKSVLQYVILKPLTAIIALIMDKYGIYVEGSFGLNTGYLYLAIINNISNTIALYGLVYFYVGTQEWLAPFKPLAKFLCIKSVLFFSFWQYSFFTWLVNLGVFGDDIIEAQQISLIIQNALICTEIFIAGIAMSQAFSAGEFIEEKRKTPKKEQNNNKNYLSNIAKVLSVNDVIQDAKITFGTNLSPGETDSLLNKVKSEENKIWEEALTKPISP